MKPLPEPGIACYDNTQLANMIEDAGLELMARGWTVYWNIKAPKKKKDLLLGTLDRAESMARAIPISKSQAKRIAIQKGEEYIPVNQKADIEGWTH